MKKILVGYDDTESAQRALRRAIDYARAFDATLVVASVAPLLVNATRSAGAIDPVSDAAEHERQLDVARSIVADAVPTEYVPAVGEPVDTLVTLADEQEADLLVVGTREPTLVARLFGQSVSAGVAVHSHRDTLIVHGEHPHEHGKHHHGEAKS